MVTYCYYYMILIVNHVISSIVKWNDMKKIVHIKVSDKGWILEKLASEISRRLPYVSYGLEADTSAEIQYYMTYGCRKNRVSPIEVALFTHKEDVTSAAEKFDAVASDVDFCIAQSIKTEDILKEIGLSNVKTISPGVDLEKFAPLVRIGVVGRTYHTGRKGEKLVAQVMDVPGIEWHFTGEGWPAPANYIEEEKLPEFYRSLDYILVPALIEGGPMCVLEALASGCKVIASPVGWVPQFPHIEFKLGDAADLRRVLEQVVEEKLALRRSVENYTWDAWAEKHHQLFMQLLGRDIDIGKMEVLVPNSVTETILPKQKKLNVIVAVHGQEMTTSLGGPSIRAPKTVAALRKIGLEANFVSNRDFTVTDADVIHVLNVWHPHECELLLQQIEKNNRPSVLSPIFLDLSELGFYNNNIKKILSDNNDIASVYEQISTLRDDIARHRNKPMAEREPLPNYFSSVRRLISFSSHLILLSELEKSYLHEIGVVHPSISVIKNPVDAALFNNGDPKLFRDAIGIDDYVLCVGRIESRKNQALLALALRDTGLPLVLVGHEADAEYAELIRKWGGDKVIFAGRIESNSPMLASAFAGARVFTLPSWSEGAPLVALEAAAAGCNMVLSNRSSEAEYFGDLASYVDPSDINDIRTKILDAWNNVDSNKFYRSTELKEKMRLEHSWENYAVKTSQAYESALKSKADTIKKSALPVIPVREKRIYVDLTTLAHHKGPPTGITRVEICLAEALHKIHGPEIYYIVWNSFHRKFIPISYSVVTNDTIKMFSEFDNPHFAPNFPGMNCDFQKDDVLLVFGSAWIRNLNYIKGLKTLKLMFGISLITAVYDVIEYKLKFLFPAARREQFTLNCKEIIAISDKVLTCSEQTGRDIKDFCLETGTPLCPISVFRLGDEAVHYSNNTDFDFHPEALKGLAPNEKFVMYVSTINVRKNHSLLLMLWKGLVNEYGDAVPRLVLVGSVGWGGEEAIEILNNNPQLNEKILLLNDVDDLTLDWLYRSCLFTVYPSRYEGWGLPVAESCRYGKFCLASNAGSLPEVAPECAEYIDPFDCIAWYKALEKYCFEPELLAQKNELAKNYVPTTWDSTAKQVLNSLHDVSSSERVASLNLGGVISFASIPESGALHSDKFTLAGWSTNERDGTWTAGNEAVLGFQFDQDLIDNLYLKVTAFGYTPSGEAIKVTVNANGKKIASWIFDGIPTDNMAPIPSSVLESSRNVIVSFHIDNPKSPSQFGSSDMRILGIHVRNVSLLQHCNAFIPSYVLPGINTATVVSRKKVLARKVINKLRRVKKLFIVN